MEWSNEDIFKFIEFYEHEAVIWDPKHPSHGDRNKVHDAWERIKVRFEEDSKEFSVKQLKAKKDALLATFRKLSQKVKQSMKTGRGTSEVYKPDWIFFEMLAKFLFAIYEPRKIISSEEDTAVIHAEKERGWDEASTTRESFSAATDEHVPKRRRFQDDTEIKKDEQCRDETRRFLKNTSDKSPPDQSSLYAELLATKLRKMDYKTRQYAMLHIDNFLFTLTHGSFQQSHNSNQFGIPPLPHPFPVISNVQQNTPQGAYSFPSPSSTSQPSPGSSYGFSQHESSNNAVQPDFNYASDPLGTNDPSMKIEEV